MTVTNRQTGICVTPSAQGGAAVGSTAKFVQAKRSRKRLAVIALLVLAVCVMGGTVVVALTSTTQSLKKRAPLSLPTDLMTSTTPTPSTLTEPSSHSGPRKFFVSSLEELRRVCHEQAPELEETSWHRTFVQSDKDVFVTAPPPKKQPYMFMPYPVCIHLETGRMFAEEAQKRVNPVRKRHSEVPLYLRNAGFYDVEELFAYMRNSEAPRNAAVQLIPAMSVMPFGSFMSTHMWHLIHDAIGQLAGVTDSVAPEFWDVPRQGVLSDEKGARWIDRNGDTPLKQRLSAMILDGFTTFATNASNSTNAGSSVPVPAFANAPIIAHSVERPPAVLGGTFPDLVSQTRCFCQNMFVPPYGVPGQPPSASALAVIQDRTALSFGAPPYRSLETESVWDIERQRTEHYPPWAQQFWHPTSTTSTTSATVYQPRVLFIHRAKRTIANVGVYVKAMRDLGFRVEEAYLERLPTEQQYYLGRYADVVVGMHGLGIGHALWMNRLPTGCRTVIEFRLWAGNGIPISLEAVLKRSLGFHYVIPEPVDVVFGPSVANPEMARRRIKEMGHGGFTHPGWDDQEAVFNESEVLPMLEGVKAHLAQCLSATVAV